LINRRSFVQLGAGALAALSHRRVHAAEPTDRSFEYGTPLQEFAYGRVAFEPGLQQAQLDQTITVLSGMSEDSLLKPFRRRAGLAAPGCDLGGLYSPNDGIDSGETFGQWISALSRYYAISGDTASRSKVHRLLDGFSRTVDSSGRILTDTNSAPAYLYDKLTCGLMDAHEFAGYPSALKTLDTLTKAAMPMLPGRALDQFESEDFGAHETYTIPENQFITWQRGGGQVHLDMARQYLHDRFYDALAKGQDALPGRHAYSHVNCLCSATRAFMVLGNGRYLSAAKKGFSFLQKQSFATGGWGPNEMFVPAPADIRFDRPAITSLLDSLTKSHRSFETGCGAYAQFKLTRDLIRITKDSSYGDSMERVMYNTILGARSLQHDGRAFYYSDYNWDGRKTFYDGAGLYPSEWPCCSGTLPQAATDYRISTYFHDQKDLYVNLYIPSTVMWSRDGTQVSLKQKGSYPDGNHVAIELQLNRAAAFALRLRIPGWTRNASVRINGRLAAGTVEPGSFFEVMRTWESGDRVDLELPHGIVLQPISPQNANIVAVTYGPLVLFVVAGQVEGVTRRDLLDASRTNKERMEWQVKTAAGIVRLLPFWEIDGEHYSTYLSVS
jgi:uncharacterized protein